MGLYKRLTGQDTDAAYRPAARPPARSPAQPPASPPASPPARSPGRPGPAAGSPPAASRAGGSISVDEQVEIMGEINDILRKNRLALKPDTFAYTPRKRGALLPILVIAGAVVFTLAAALGIAAYFDAGERTLVRRSAVLLTAEAKLIQALKQESAEQLGRKDQEIARIQDSLQAVARDRDRLKQDSQAELARREAALKQDLERELAAERQRLEGEGLKSEAVERRLADLQARLTEEGRRQLADYRRQAEAELAARDASLAAMGRRHEESLAAFRRERAELEQQSRRREQELAAELGAQTAAAQSEASRLAGQLGALNEQRERERTASEQVQAALQQAEQERRRLQAQLDRAEQELARLRPAERRRAAQAAQLQALQNRIEASPAAPKSQAEVLALLDTKLRVRQALATEPLSSRYPGLYEELERYLDAFGQEQQRQGQADVLQDIAVMLEGLAQQVPRLDVRRLGAAYLDRAREPFNRVVTRLRDALK